MSAGKNGGDQIFQRGTDYFQKILVPPDHLFGPGGLFFGGTNCYMTGHIILRGGGGGGEGGHNSASLDTLLE